ncbi:DNA cytosine methyltransferase [uncultured Brevundimonas sp.]|uniref:DNA cytosine methyltransferase n=1 Tax=uncultured Brevundimonas sp. TaxID=213418 RepID=UPI0025F7D148|nr:DNA cytosine methyltransferase [uncultured Brevundimonas sp.]
MLKGPGKERDRPEAATIASAPTYIDIFAGCGGLSLGLHRAGWRGLFAIEKDPFAFATLEANFLTDSSRYSYDWPSWLPRQPSTVEGVIAKHRDHLVALRGKVDLLAGGPPCQGFSSAGRRRADDPRNVMVDRYLELVEILQPKVILLENVRGFTLDFKARAGGGTRENAAAQLSRKLVEHYDVEAQILRACDFGVPQNRPRFILVGTRKGLGLDSGALADLRVSKALVLQGYGLAATTSAQDAISDLEIGRNDLHPCPDSPGFEAIGYTSPLTPYQRAMRDGHDGHPSDTRLAKHTPTIRERFADIIQMCKDEGRSNRQLSPEMRAKLGITKMATRVLDPKLPAPTVTSMPDDLLHYSEPRTLTVRENARLQSFPDWFVFRGKYTTGGHRRRVEVPRFTQVANAVPPLLAEILGHRLKHHCLRSSQAPAEVG